MEKDKLIRACIYSRISDCDNYGLLAFQSDILLAEVVRPKVVEVTALGASYLAGLKVGYWKDIEDIRNNKIIERVFAPADDSQKRERRLKGWKTAVAMARYKPEI